MKNWLFEETANLPHHFHSFIVCNDCSSRSGQKVCDAEIERRTQRLGFQFIVSKIPVPLLSAATVVKLLRVTRCTGEPIITPEDMTAYGQNALDNNYARDVLRRGIDVFKTRSDVKMYTVFHFPRRDNKGYMIALGKNEGPRVLGRLLKVQQHAARYASPATEYDSVMFARDMYHRPRVHGLLGSSLACTILGLPEFDGELRSRSSKPHVDALLESVAALDRTDPTILACPDIRNPARCKKAGSDKGAGSDDDDDKDDDATATRGGATAGAATGSSGVVTAVVTAGAAAAGSSGVLAAVGATAGTSGVVAAAVGDMGAAAAGSSGVVAAVVTVGAEAGSSGVVAAAAGDVGADEVRNLANRINFMPSLQQGMLFAGLRDDLSRGARGQLRLQLGLPSMDERPDVEKLKLLARDQIARLKVMQRGVVDELKNANGGGKGVAALVGVEATLGEYDYEVDRDRKMEAAPDLMAFLDALMCSPAYEKEMERLRAFVVDVEEQLAGTARRLQSATTERNHRRARGRGGGAARRGGVADGAGLHRRRSRRFH
jgi:hypothetical protein